MDDRRQFLEQFRDTSADPPRAANREELERREIDRISRALAIVIVAGSIPRRLGGDATDEDLALDKKRAKRAGHALAQALRGWTKKAPQLEADAEVKAAGAQLSWQPWCEAHMTDLQNRRREIATWAIAHEEERWGRSAIVRLNNEENWLSYALRD